MSLESLFREQLSLTLREGNAHMSFEAATADFPPGSINGKPAGVPYSYWHLVEHLRITQRDILDYIRNTDYQEPHWPNDYWPDRDATTDEQGWQTSIAAFLDDRSTLIAMADDPECDLSATVPSSEEHTILRELFIVADHNAYHVGELAILRQTEGIWGASHTD